jgi:glutamyl-Q tRNA(Asp) synthetase
MPIAITTRFAPSPTGGLHLGHAFSALFADHFASQAAGRFLLRIEDIDGGRCRPEFEAAIVEDLTWLGLTWEEPVRRQSEHIDDYANALSRLEAEGLLYPCFCTRADIRREIAASARAPHGPDGPLYPGSCRDLTPDERTERQARGLPFARRLDMRRAAVQAGPLFWNDQAMGRITVEPNLFGDVILARKDVPTSYHLACTVDDHLQGVTLVTRGEDLFPSTHIHRL